ncbi:ABC transporter substrate-binding protein [Sedimentibacter sp. zth1]|uniref:ABC transporter substrate-binding protein n=1 Tax=Sedimentibacter sp. zth1 TaxID=2816908 RepID=UPI001A914980|nr:ABC transporter substrate-binding protein [Sedimentibacter sp. zth1]QSX05358.1 ABC transporter substrate-binding protein [Sedimentibacter sp. zth1]
MKLGRLKKLLCCLTACAFLFTGCSASDANKPNDNNAQQEKQDKIVVGIPQDFDSLDPHLSNATGTQEVMFNVFTGLVSPSSNGEIISEIAESYTTNQDMTTYTFKLRKNVKFHDGSDLTASDVKYSLDRVCGKTEDQKEPLSSAYANVIDNVIAEDDYTVKINLTSTDASFLSKMTLAIIPENSGATQAEKPIGAGPYKFISYTPGMSLTLEKNDDYYIEGQPKIQNAEFKIYSDMNAAVFALSNGEINYMNMTEDYISQISTDKFIIETYPMNTVQLLGLNNDFEPFKDIRVRQALNYAIDKDTIINMLSKGAKKLGTNFSPVMPYYYQDGLEDYYKYDIEKARQLLNEAGYSDLKFTCKVASEYKLNTEAAQIIQQQLLEVGVDMQIETIDWGTWLEDVYTNRNHEATVIGFTGKLDPDGILKRYVSDYRKNFINFKNNDYDNLINKAAVEVNNDKRAEYYKQAETILAEEASSVYIMDPSYQFVIDNRLEGYVFYPINFIDLRTLQFK